MSLVTLQRESPESIDILEIELNSKTVTETTLIDATKNKYDINKLDDDFSTNLDLSASSSVSINNKQQNISLIEKYFVLKDAALILPKRLINASYQPVPMTTCKSSSCCCCSLSSAVAGDILIHLQAMVSLLRPQDTINLAIKLTSFLNDHIRYLVIVETASLVNENQIEYAILGIDLKLTTIQNQTSNEDDLNSRVKIKCTIGLVLPLYSNFKLSLDCDGGFKLQTFNSNHLFKPVSIQAMWSAYQYLYKLIETVKCRVTETQQNYQYDWLRHYTTNIQRSEQDLLNEWNQSEERSQQRDDYTTPYFNHRQFLMSQQPQDTSREQKYDEKLTTDINEKLREIIKRSKDDYGLMSSVTIRSLLETELGCSLEFYKRYIDAIVFQFYNQLVECATQLLPWGLYLGTEWNASDYDNLIRNNITHIINVSYEVDNFFPDSNIKYLNIRVLDNEKADLLKEFDRAFKFINEAREQQTSCLVHCKMGVSRSASICVAYIMKEESLSHDDALRFVKQKRPCVNPNKNFMTQLNTYESILQAHRSKYNLFEPLTIDIGKEITNTTASSVTTLFDENELVVGAVKDAINKIQMKSVIAINSSHTNDLTLVSPLNMQTLSSPSSSSSSSSSSSPLFVDNTLIVEKQEPLIRRCHSMKFRESPKEIKRTPSYLNNNDTSSNNSVKKIAEDLMLSTSALNIAQFASTNSLNDEVCNSVPIGIVKRQVESINFKSRPCTPESEENYESALNNELAMGSTNELLKLQGCKRCKIDSNENLTEHHHPPSVNCSSRSSKKVFDFLADKLKENKNQEMSCDYDVSNLATNDDIKATNNPLIVLENK